MAPSSYEVAASILLCAEDSSSILDLEAEAEEEALLARSGEPGGGAEFPVPSEECVAGFLESEAAHMPREDYAERLRSGGMDLRVRTDAIDWIWKVHTCYGFGPLTACLAVNYLDRFLSLYQLPEGKAWMTQLLSVACLSLAAKMEETYVPSSLDLQQAGDARYVFEAKTIQRMELLVLSTLKWRMQAVTPLSYVDYFLHRLRGGAAPSRRAVLRSAELILCIARGTHCLDFRPSEIALAVAATVAGEERAVDIDRAFTHRVHKERVSRCLEAIQQATATMALPQPLKSEGPSSSGRRASSSSATVPRSPTGVLDAGCLSYRRAAAAAASHASSSWRDEDDDDCPPAVCSKRRKISR
ncbi:cyclin delta-2 isoform X1 [Zea mays]|uniref:Cyclin N-terminal domain-containing protein n=1 Tax=Zea mays TaxID=4577 RepID=A0A804QCI2_MAIZE|nr:cyclin delta-2 isoform X1 [Zea mays]|eukprot:XP_020396136.1 cyclin delta-2 isoform X1 [Zea mays]